MTDKLEIAKDKFELPEFVLSKLVPIDTADKLEHSVLLNLQLAWVGVLHAYKSRYRPEHVEKSFSETLKENTFAISPIESLLKLVNGDIVRDRELAVLDLLAGIDNVYSNTGLTDEDKIEKIWLLIKDLTMFAYENIDQDKLKQYNEQREGTTIDKEGSFGILGISKPVEYQEDDQELGIEKGDMLLELHIPAQYKTTGDSVGFKDSCELLASAIVKKKMPIDKIIGESWLLDRPRFAKALFTKTRTSEAMPKNIPQQWFQFITKDGQIDKKRVAKLLQAGDFPYALTKGSISIEDFLARFAPDELCGKSVVLEVIGDRAKAEIGAFDSARLEFKKALDAGEVIGDVVGVHKEVVAKSTILTEIFKTDVGKVFVLELSTHKDTQIKEFFMNHKDLSVRFESEAKRIIDEVKVADVREKKIHIPEKSVQ